MTKYFLGCLTACAILAGVSFATSLNTTASSSPAFRVRCRTSATPVSTLSVSSYRSVRCASAANENNIIYMGDSNVTTDNGYAICGHVSCMEQQITLNTGLAFCVVESGIVELSCIALK
tara:strand:- start:16 stop:372 length:357 start_codon:yes stop_codon:yes gene_type:complete